MTKTKLHVYVKERFGMDLYEFIKQKVEVDTLHDYEIASILNVSTLSIGRWRKIYEIKKVDGFSRGFKHTYGEGALETFKKVIENPYSTLADVGRYFGFTREYARHVYKKIYGRSYTKAHKRKLVVRKKERFAEKDRESKQMANLIRVAEKIKSMGHIAYITNRGRTYMISTNGYKLCVRYASAPVRLGKKQYFRITTPKRTNADFDFLICLCRNGKDNTYFIIPSDFMPRSIVTLLPQATPDQSKYARFRDAWHLLMHKI